MILKPRPYHVWNRPCGCASTALLVDSDPDAFARINADPEHLLDPQVHGLIEVNNEIVFPPCDHLALAKRTRETIAHVLMGDHANEADRAEAAHDLAQWIDATVVIDTLLIAANARCEASAQVRMAAVVSLAGTRDIAVINVLTRLMARDREPDARVREAMASTIQAIRAGMRREAA